MIGGQVNDLEGEGKPPDARAARDHPSRQDRGAAARQRCAWARSTPAPSDGAVRGALLLRRARRPGVPDRGRHAGRGGIVRGAGQDRGQGRRAAQDHLPGGLRPGGVATAWPSEECERAHAALEPFGDRARAPARTGRSDRSAANHEDAARPPAGGARSGRVAREGAGADHGRRGARRRAEGGQARPAGGGRCRASKCSRARPT